MAEVTNELIYALLKQVDQQLGELSQDFSEVKSELGSIRGHMISTKHDLKNIHGMLARRDDQLDRIERSLDGA
ncbi:MULTISPECIES: hypothetical protein [unclassified Mesorhizobium]|uniref:hypothetical protein n=1 Tax=unclassified Mesorhizobium TaxID=325217 RepID=UPI000FCC493F|nr:MULTISPECIES: hypothetical protein [unclassified Mesorhizobium]RUW69341.1 hypothetical protein EOA31_23335 [Mesorhizobium sp. M4B.F.Ca.ET.049.02.1.2]TGV26256.1 hypothetical protein EN786_12055 [Mesorhizobium sp. M4B.F.Ca.ET.143.01.1.1]